MYEFLYVRSPGVRSFSFYVFTLFGRTVFDFCRGSYFVVINIHGERFQLTIRVTRDSNGYVELDRNSLYKLDWGDSMLKNEWKMWCEIFRNEALFLRKFILNVFGAIGYYVLLSMSSYYL